MNEPYTILNQASEPEARALLGRCCGATRWVSSMLALRPYASSEALLEAADAVWGVLGASDYLEAFSHHPQIGADVASLRAKFGATHDLASTEQAGVQGASDTVLLALRDANQAYLQRFGYIFIVCATGKTAAQMLALLEARMRNPPERELTVAAAEQAAITKLRLLKVGA